MTRLMNDPAMSVAYGNTGLPGKTINPATFQGSILIHKSNKIPAASLVSAAACLAWLQAATLKSGTERIYPLFKFEALTDGTADPEFQKLGFGTEAFIKEGKYVWTFQFLKGGIAFNRQLRTFNMSEDYDVIFIDIASPNRIYGRLSSEGDLHGLTTDMIYTYPWKAPDGSKVPEYRIKFVLSDPAELNDSYGVFKLYAALMTMLKGILNVNLEVVASDATSVTVTVIEEDSRTHLYDSFSTALAAAAAFLIKKANTPVTPVSIVVNANLKGFVITLTAPTGVHDICLVTPVALAALHVGEPPAGGFESDTVSHTFA